MQQNRHPMGRSASSTTSQASSTTSTSTPISSSLSNFLEQFCQRIFTCCQSDLLFLSRLETQDDENNMFRQDSYFYRIQSNFESWVVEAHDFHGKVMAPFDLFDDGPVKKMN